MMLITSDQVVQCIVQCGAHVSLFCLSITSWKFVWAFLYVMDVFGCVVMIMNLFSTELFQICKIELIEISMKSIILKYSDENIIKPSFAIW